MAEIVFHLPGILKSGGEPRDFTGPLALILQLLSRRRIEARDISASEIINQYLAWFEEMTDIDAASEFVAMAAHLMYIKTKMMLGGDEPEELAELISSLERLRAADVYVGIKEVSARFREMYTLGAGLITKPPEYFTLLPDESYKYSHGADELTQAFESILLRAVSPEAVLRTVKTGYPRPAAYPIDGKIEEILEALRNGGTLELRALFDGCSGRSETVAAFVAVLELCARGRAALSEDGAHLSPVTVDIEAIA